MGIIWSRFRKKPSTKEILKKIQEEIDHLEEYKEKTEQTRRKLILNLAACSVLVYSVFGVMCYFYYLPSTLEEKLLYVAYFIGSLIIIYLVKNFLTCYYKWKVCRNEKKLVTLKNKKEDLLDQVMETETYKVAKDILETFAPEQIRKGAMTIKTSNITTPTSSNQRVIAHQSGEVRRRIVSPQASRTYAPRPTSPALNSSSLGKPLPYSRTSLSPRPVDSLCRNVDNSFQNYRIAYVTRPSPNSSSFNWSNDSVCPRSDSITPGAGEPPGPPMPRPILPRERGIMDRFIEYLVGDGPSNRFALVCRQCESHNGMALKEEFPYIAFRCAYCFYWNPARRQKPAPPKLDTMIDSPQTAFNKELDESSDEDVADKEKKEIPTTTIRTAPKTLKKYRLNANLDEVSTEPSVSSDDSGAVNSEDKLTLDSL